MGKGDASARVRFGRSLSLSISSCRRGIHIPGFFHRSRTEEEIEDMRCVRAGTLPPLSPFHPSSIRKHQLQVLGRVR